MLSQLEDNNWSCARPIRLKTGHNKCGYVHEYIPMPLAFLYLCHLEFSLESPRPSSLNGMCTWEEYCGWGLTSSTKAIAIFRATPPCRSSSKCSVHHLVYNTVCQKWRAWILRLWQKTQQHARSSSVGTVDCRHGGNIWYSVQCWLLVFLSVHSIPV